MTQMREEAFWAVLDAALPRWRERREHPLVVAGFTRSRAETQDELLREVVASALGAALEPEQALDGVLDLRLDRVCAHAAIERGLRRTLAYNGRWVKRRSASRVADAFVACFSSDATFFTNGSLWLENPRNGGWSPLTSATFDTGIVGVDGAGAGILWVMDED